jgi:uncharacterized protein
LFAVLHDSRRINEGSDPDHGPRAAEFARTLRGRLFDLPDHEFRLLHRACAGHTHERTHPDVTIRTCWDADRLDIGRIGITPHPSRLCTEMAKRPAMIQWADGRASFGVVPELVREEWGIDLEDDPRQCGGPRRPGMHRLTVVGTSDGQEEAEADLGRGAKEADAIGGAG